jgi:hypothetical protein
MSWLRFHSFLSIGEQLRGVLLNRSKCGRLKGPTKTFKTQEISGSDLPARRQMGGQPRKVSKLRWCALSPSGECAFVNPVDIKSALGEKPNAVDLHKGVEVTERRNHHAPLLIVDRQVMRQAVSLGCAANICQRENGALPDEVRGGFVFVQLGEHWRKRLARTKFLRRSGIFGIHIHHEMGVCSEERHLTLRVATIGRKRVRLDKLADREAIGGITGREENVFAY